MPRRKRTHSPNFDQFSGEDDSFDDDSNSGRVSGVGGAMPQRNAANARERARMRVLSRAFCRLKTTLPWVPPDTKLSKLDTLRLAASYIAHLRAALDDGDGEMGGDNGVDAKPHPKTLTWPFTFHHCNSSTQLGRGDDTDSPNSWSPPRHRDPHLQGGHNHMEPYRTLQQQTYCDGTTAIIG